MTFALVIDGTIEVGRLPGSARRLDDGRWVMDLSNVVDRQACGWFEVTDTPRPDDTATTTYTRSLILVGGAPVVTWTPVDKTQVELDADTAQAADSTEDDQIRQMVSALRDYLALALPTAAQTRQQVDRLTRVAIRLIRNI
jgi:hypothetical protein